MSRRKLKINQQNSLLSEDMEKKKLRNQELEIEEMLTSPELKKFEAFLFESMNYKQKLSEKFSQFIPLTHQTLLYQGYQKQ